MWSRRLTTGINIWKNENFNWDWLFVIEQHPKHFQFYFKEGWVYVHLKEELALMFIMCVLFESMFKSIMAFNVIDCSIDWLWVA